MKEKEGETEVKEAKRGPTIEDGVKLYGQPAWHQIKTVIYAMDNGEFVRYPSKKYQHPKHHLIHL